MSKEFTSKGYLGDRWICYRHDVKKFVKSVLKTLLRINKQPRFALKQRYTERYAKNLVLKKKVALIGEEPSWFYWGFERQDDDPLTNYTLQYIGKTIKKESKVLVTGCGAGITVFHLADCGFKEVVGFDLLPE